MTKTKNNAESTPKKPTHYAYSVRERDGQKGFWTKIGAAWSHGDDLGFSVQIDTVPLDGRITLRVASDPKE